MALAVAFFTIPPNPTPSNLRSPSRKDFCFDFLQLLKPTPPRRRRRIRRELTSAAAMFTDNVFVSDIIAEGLSGGIALSLLKLWEQTATRGVFDQVCCSFHLWFVSIGEFWFCGVCRYACDWVKI